MRIPRKILWLAVFAFCTFWWIIVFQHGLQPDRFLSGARTELSRVLVWLARLIGRPA